jgi:hypothetical protein
VITIVKHRRDQIQGDITEQLYRDVDIYAAPQDVVLTTRLPDIGIPTMVRITSAIYARSCKWVSEKTSSRQPGE